MSLEDLCERCSFKPYAGCINGDVITDLQANKSTMCPHLRVRLAHDNFKLRVTPEIFNCTPVKSSPLFIPSSERGKPAPVNLAKKNLWIKGMTWPAFLPHLRYVLMGLPNLKFRVVNDHRIKEVFVGAESMKSLSRVQRDAADRADREVNNAIGDIVGEAYDLVVIQLGLLGYKNISAAGVLKEALMMRVTQGKATWLFETSDRNINWQHSRDPDVEAYVEDNFEITTISSEVTIQESDLGNISVEEHGEEEVVPPTQQLELAVPDEEVSEDPPALDGDAAFSHIRMGGEDGSGKKPKYKPRKGRY